MALTLREVWRSFRQSVSSGAAHQDFLAEAADMGDGRLKEYARAQRYYEGDHRVQLNTREREYLETSGLPYAENFCSTIVDTKAGGLKLRRLEAEDEMATFLRDLWRTNDLSILQKRVHKGAVKLGDYFVIVEPGRETADGFSPPSLCPNHPSNVKIVYDSDEPLYAVKIWNTSRRAAVNPKGRAIRRLNIYWPDAIERYYSESSTGSVWAPFRQSEDDEGNIDFWTMNGEPDGEPIGIPVVHFANAPDPFYGASKLRGVIPQADALNKTLIDFFWVMDAQGWPQQYATGTAPTEVTRHPGSLWTIEADNAKVGQLPPADPEKAIAAIESQIKRMSSRSNTPLHLMLAGGNLPSGEALALDTPVSTPQGLRPIGEIQEGDAVFAPSGRPETVTGAYETWVDRPCFRLRFDTGEEIVADARHRWLTSHYANHLRGSVSGRIESVVTTQEIHDTLRVPSKGSGRKRDGESQAHHRIALTAPLDYGSADLPIDPYVLGAWLGDGDSNAPTLTAHEDDADHFIDRIADAGERPYAAYVNKNRNRRLARIGFGALDQTRCWRGHQKEPGHKCRVCDVEVHRLGAQGTTIAVADPATSPAARGRLTQIGVLNNKHIPKLYFRTSAEQRLELLRGIMDTDGTATKDGRAAIDLHSERLAHDTHRLILSLGHKATIREREYTNKLGTFTRYRICWSPLSVVFSLPRKVARQRTDWGPKASNRYIVACERIAPVPVRCISVTGDDHLFLLGHAGIATHNTLKTSESGYTREGQDFQEENGGRWVKTARVSTRIANAFDPDRNLPEDAEIAPVWEGIETRNEVDEANVAVLKQSIGVSTDTLLAELGYDPEKEREKREQEVPAIADELLDRAKQMQLQAPTRSEEAGGGQQPAQKPRNRRVTA